MREKKQVTFDSPFAEEVFNGLTAFPKYLSSKYIYDTKGDELFQRIMAMPEYYLTNSEFAILESFKNDITTHFSEGGKPFNLIELGAGDGSKTKILLQELLQNKVSFRYMPIDISENALEILRKNIIQDLPQIDLFPVQGTYFESLEELCNMPEEKKVILFLGSNIGNLLHPQAVDFLVQIQELMSEDDILFIGFDQKKHPKLILDAYNDPAGITEAFNKNLLVRINRELGGNFDPDKFIHWEVYDPESGTAKSYLVSKQKQKVYLESLQTEVFFEPWETIHTEISQKYNSEVVQWLSEKAGLQITREYSDAQNYFKNYILKKKV